MQEPLSIVIPTLERQKCLMDTVRDILAQTYLRGEVIIVDQSKSRDEALLDFLEKATLGDGLKIHYYHVNFKGLPVARNFGTLKSGFPVIVYIDDDVNIPVDFLTEHAKAQEASGAAIVAGGIEEKFRKDNPSPTRTGHFNFWTATPIRDFNAKSEQWVYTAPGGNFSVRREAFEKIGGFDERLTLGAALYEETEFCLRARKNGYKIFFAPKARLTHLAYPTGGCRVEEVPDYIWALARNRMFIIYRYLSWYHWPSAAARLSLLILSYFRVSWHPKVILRGLAGILTGLSEARLSPRIGKITDYQVIFEKHFGRTVR